MVTLEAYRDEAKAARQNQSVIYSRSPAFTWADAAVLQCNIALGYIDGGYLDEVSTQKCDCFHSRMQSFM